MNSCLHVSLQVLDPHIETVVTWTVANFLGFLITTRHHEVGEVPGQVDMNPTSLPELF